jgi:hypothetical protein
MASVGMKNLREEWLRFPLPRTAPPMFFEENTKTSVGRFIPTRVGDN